MSLFGRAVESNGPLRRPHPKMVLCTKKASNTVYTPNNQDGRTSIGRRKAAPLFRKYFHACESVCNQ